ncbi:MAG: hypothetical protein M3355_11825 [Actinomycetota bacterium]|nr:hypothetical protein [Actinomycetota bacterium]
MNDQTLIHLIAENVREYMARRGIRLPHDDKQIVETISRQLWLRYQPTQEIQNRRAK